MNIQVLVYVLFLVVITQEELVTILKNKYWKEILYQENDVNAPIPTEIQHSTDKILVFMENHALSFMQSDFTKPKILTIKKQNSQIEKKAKTFQDKAGNKILNVNGHLIHTYYKTGDIKMITAKVPHYFKEVALDGVRNIAYVIGRNNDGSSGKLFAFNTNKPVIKTNEPFVDAIEILGQDIKCIALDKDTGNLAYIEAKEKNGWKLISLVINDFKLMVESTEEPYESEDHNEDVIITAKSSSGLHNDFNDAIKLITSRIMSLNDKECDKSVSKLLNENRRLQRQIEMMDKTHRYLLKGKGIYLTSPKNSYVDTTKKYQELKEEFKNIVRDVENNITQLLNEKNVVWLDEGKAVLDPNSKWVHIPLVAENETKEDIDKHKQSCGILKTDPSRELFPWTVAILGSSLPHKFICYGTLIHPKVVIISLKCSQDYEKYGSAIVRSGTLDVSLLNTEQPAIDRNVVGKMFIGIRALILYEEFSVDGKIEVACSTLDKNTSLPNSKCFGLPKQSSMSKAVIIDFTDIEPCDPKVADSRFICIKQKANQKLCKSLNDGMYNHAIYCPSQGEKLQYILYGTHLRWHNCTQVLVSQKVYDQQTADELVKLNIDLKPFH